MFINFTNHRSELWSSAQREAAEVFGEIVDIPFPTVDPSDDISSIIGIAEKYAGQICGCEPEAVLVQGEMTLSFAVVKRLRAKGIKAVCATTERIISEHIGENGETIKQSEFRFVGFRDYE